MTREEARDVVSKVFKNPKTETSNVDFYIDLLIGFGVLNLEKSKTPEMLLYDELQHTTLEPKYANITHAIDAAGLRLVRK